MPRAHASANASVPGRARAEASAEARVGRSGRGDRAIRAQPLAKRQARDSRCAFRGRLEAVVPLYSDDASGLVLATLNAVHVELRLPSEYGARLPATVSYPIEAAGYVESPTLWLTERYEVVPGHIWVPVGTPVEAYSAAEARVRVRIPLGSPDALAHSPSEFGGNLPCGSLSVDRPKPAPPPNPGPSLELRDGRVVLHDKPFGTPIGFFTADEHAASFVSERDGWYRVLLKRPFHADAWIERTALAEDQWLDPEPKITSARAPKTDPETGEVPQAKTKSTSMPSEPGAARDRSISLDPLEVRLQPERAAAVVARIARGAAISRIRDRGAFVEVQVSGVSPAAGAHFYVGRREYAAWAAATEESRRNSDRERP